jgi:hypothetical protein
MQLLEQLGQQLPKLLVHMVLMVVRLQFVLVMLPKLPTLALTLGDFAPRSTELTTSFGS